MRLHDRTFAILRILLNVMDSQAWGIRTRARFTKHVKKAMDEAFLRKASRRRLKGTALQEMPHLRRTKN